MDTCPKPHWAYRVRDALLIAAAGLAVSTSPLSGGESKAPSVESLLRRLDDPRFEIRTAAERELTRLKAVDIPVLEKAATFDAEQAARIVALLERLYVGQSASKPELNPARAALLSSLDPMLAIRRAGDYGETELTKAADEALGRLASGTSPAAPIAEAALARHAVLAESRAITMLRQLGAKIVFSERRDAMHDAVAQLAEGAATGPTTADPGAPPPPLSVEHVYILRSWSGGKDGLKYLARLRTGGGLQLYLVDGCGVTLEDTLVLKAEIPGLTPVERSAATLGVRSSNYPQFTENGGCEIAGVSEGLAADRAGLRSNFIIKAVNGDPIVTFDDGTPKSLVHRLRGCAPRETVTLTIKKMPNGPEEQVPVTLSDWSDVADVQMIGYR
jgi:hypothetical protein